MFFVRFVNGTYACSGLGPSFRFRPCTTYSVCIEANIRVLVCTKNVPNVSRHVLIKTSIFCFPLQFTTIHEVTILSNHENFEFQKFCLNLEKLFFSHISSSFDHHREF